jgi:hypothetical protein
MPGRTTAIPTGPTTDEVDVEHMSGTIANVTVRSTADVEYLQLVRTRDGWRIVNALWRYA